MPLFPQSSPVQTPDPSNFDASLASGGYSAEPQASPAPTPQTLAAPSSLQQAQTADNVHHSLFGRAVKATVRSLEGTRSEYRANPETGQIEETTAPNKPGQFFRNLLVGALVGGAAGSENTGRAGGGGFLGGFARGGTGALQYKQQQDQARFARAQEQLKSGMEREKLTDEENTHAVLRAHEFIQTAQILHNIHMSDQKAVEEHNASARAYKDSLVEAGGVPFQFTVDGKLSDTIDGPTFQAAFTKDPSIARAGPGFQRHFISDVDLSEIHYDGNRWLDDSGTPVNMGPKISLQAYDIPTANFKTPVARSGKEINAARRQRIVDPNKTYMVSPEAMSALYTSGAKDQNEARNARSERTFTAIASRKAAALARAERDYHTGLSKLDTTGRDPDKVDELQQQLFDAKQDAQNNFEEQIESAGGTVNNHFEYPAPTPQARPQANPQTNTPKTFSPSKWKTANPNGDVSAAINEAKRQGMTIGQ